MREDELIVLEEVCQSSLNHSVTVCLLAIHSLKLSRSHVDWHSVDEVYLYSDATTSKIARTVTQKLGFSKGTCTTAPAGFDVVMSFLYNGGKISLSLSRQPPAVGRVSIGATLRRRLPRTRRLKLHTSSLWCMALARRWTRVASSGTLACELCVRFFRSESIKT